MFIHGFLCKLRYVRIVPGSFSSTSLTMCSLKLSMTIELLYHIDYTYPIVLLDLSFRYRLNSPSKLLSDSHKTFGG